MPASSPHITNGVIMYMKKHIFSQPQNARTCSTILEVACRCDAQACRVPTWTLFTAAGPLGVCQRLQKTSGASKQRRTSEQWGIWWGHSYDYAITVSSTHLHTHIFILCYTHTFVSLHGYSKFVVLKQGWRNARTSHHNTHKPRYFGRNDILNVPLGYSASNGRLEGRWLYALWS